MSIPMPGVQKRITDQKLADRENVAPSFSWIYEFHKRKGRKLRILHIGNIANNAYNNARIQRRYGIEADVICFDYYHSMATPEWEDGELQTVVDSSMPDWWSTNLRGFRRPSWFVQGPMLLCIGYLFARCKGQKIFAIVRKWGLETAYWNLLEDKAKLTGVTRNIPVLSRPLIYRHLSKLDPWKTLAQLLASSRRSLREMVLKPLAIAATSKPPVVPGGWMLISVWRVQRNWRKLPSVFNRENLLTDLAEAKVLANFSVAKIFADSLSIIWTLILETLLFILLLPLRLVTRRARIAWKSMSEREARASELVEEFRKTEREVPQTVWNQLHRYLSANALSFSPILRFYDVVQGYSIDGIIPLANGLTNFTAYEHGTLRDIPFENTLLGLKCRLAYRYAPISFVTNSDVIQSTERLGLEQRRLRFLPHAFDETKLFRFREDNPDLKPPKDCMRVFCPSRHHWKTGDVSWRKGNDVLLRGAALAAVTNRNFRLTLVEWGQEVGLSKELLEELQIADLVEWVQPMGKRDLWRAYCTSHAVVDQFIMPALGGVGFEAMALGCRLISRIDESQLSEFFGESPPVINASSPAEVASALLAVIEDPWDNRGIGAAGKKWIKHFHSAERIVGIQISAYKSLLEDSSLSPAGYSK